MKLQNQVVYGMKKYLELKRTTGDRQKWREIGCFTSSCESEIHDDDDDDADDKDNDDDVLFQLEIYQQFAL